MFLEEGSFISAKRSSGISAYLTYCRIAFNEELGVD